MPQRSPGPLATARTAAWLLALACAAGSAPAHSSASEWVVQPGQSASELALDQVPSGTTIDQFLLAIYLRNPQAFAEGAIDRLQAQARLRLPSADEANEVPPDQAREQLARLRAGQPLATPSTTLAQAPAVASDPSERLAEAVVAPPPAVAAKPPQSLAEPAVAPPPSGAADSSNRLSQPVKPPSPEVSAGPAHSAWAVWLAAGLALLGTLWWWSRRRPQTAQIASPPSSDLEAHAQGRFQPVLPTPPSVGARPSGRMVPEDDAPLAASDRPGGRAPTGDSKPALFDLGLSLDGQAPPLDGSGLSLDLNRTPVGARPSGRMVTEDDAPLASNGRPGGRAPTGDSKPALFDLDLSLDGQAPPLDGSGLSLNLNRTPVGARPPGRSVANDDAPLAANDRPGGRAPTGDSKPALFDLDLSLDGQAPPLNLDSPRKERP